MPIAKDNSGSSTTLTEIIKSFTEITANAEEYLKPQTQRSGSILALIQKTYEATIAEDVGNEREADILPELVVEDMDEEQIWQQLELRNNIVLPQYLNLCAKLLALREENLEIQLDESDGEEEAEENEALSEGNEDPSEHENKLSDNEEQQSNSYEDEDDAAEQEVVAKRTKPKQKVARKSIVDDKFFKLSEMEEFLEQEDAKELRKQKGKKTINDDEGIDYFAEDLGDNDNVDSDEDNVNYNDFFDEDRDLVEDTSNKTKNSIDFFNNKENEFEDEEGQNSVNENDEELEESDNEQLQAGEDNMQPASDSETDDEDEQSNGDSSKQEEEVPKSSYEMRDARLQQRIREYEQEVLGEKPWQLKGEVQAVNRPQNSLLEEILEFDATTRPAPVITEDTTRCLEDIIKQRIRDQAWDDVEPRARPNNTPQDYRKQLVLDQEKSKESLAKIYEKEYQREIEKLNPNLDADAAGNEKEPKEHLEIRKLMRELFIKLDALSNFHFTPKPVAPEAKIITNTPAVAMEEIAPVAVSDAKLLAPEEVFRGPKNSILGKSERTSTDKNRERRKKKQKQRAINSILEKRDQQRLKDGKPLSKKAEGTKLLKNITKHRNVETITTSNDHGSLKSSKAFFNKLQDTTITSNGFAQKRAAKKQTEVMSKLNAKKLKL